VRQRKEVQKVLRGLGLNRAQRSAAAAFLARLKVAATPCALGLLWLGVLPLGGAILPDKIGDFTKGETKALAAPDPALYQEFGFIAAEHAQYTIAAKRFTASAWRLRDSTGALALFEAQRPANAAPAKLTALFAKTPDGAIFA